MNKLNSILVKKSKDKNICSSWLKKIKKATYQEMADMFFDGSDWALENDFPDKNDVVMVYEEMENLGLYVMQKYELTNIDRGAFFGSSSANIVMNGYKVSEIIVRHNAKINLRCDEHSIAYLTVLDKAEVKITAKNSSKCFVRQFGDDCKVNFTQGGDNIKIRQAQWENS